VPGFFFFSFLLSFLTPTEGMAERREAVSLVRRARNSATPRLRSVGRPAQPERRLAALHRDGFGPSSHSAVAELPPLPQSGDPRAGCLRPVGQGSRTSRQRFYEPPRDATSRSTFKKRF
jgi:hypothetical protein